MAASLTGSVQFFDSSSASPGNQSVTVPADATAAVMFAVGWSGDTTMTGATLNSVAFTLTQNSASDDSVQVVGRLEAPSTGTQNFAWTWNAAISEGAIIALCFIKDSATSSMFRDADQSLTSGDDVTASVTIDSETTDFVIAMVASYIQNADGAPGGSGQTVISDNHAFNAYVVDIVTEDAPGASSTTVSGFGDYVTVGAVSIKEAGGAPAAPAAAAQGTGLFSLGFGL